MEKLMATQEKANVYINNSTGGQALIMLYHENSSNGVQSAAFFAGPGARVGPLVVHFETGSGSHMIKDFWAVTVNVRDGAHPGQYANAGALTNPGWKECVLEPKDADQTLVFDVTTASFTIGLKSGNCTDSMRRVAPFRLINNVFVLMLENHSFDNVFGQSGIPGIIHATSNDSNTYNGVTYRAQGDAPPNLVTDPGHEFLDVLEQLAGANAKYSPDRPYPPVNLSGFVSNYATSTTEGPKPPPGNIGYIMRGFDTPQQLNVLYSLAREYAICDRWFASMPGPTWPNRFFVHGASSSGLDHSPTDPELAKWESLDGFKFKNGSIFDALKASDPKLQWRIYNDNQNHYALFPAGPLSGGEVPQVAALHGINVLDIHSMSDFASDLRRPYPFNYTFIEPHYGNIFDKTYSGGSSQHPKDDMYGGENLIRAVYEAIRSSPIWETSLLIITYDEHGGFYDSVAPGPAPAPNDGSSSTYNQYGFDFKKYGVRVPAVVVSPFIKPNTVNHDIYDHTSILATLRSLFQVHSLTSRDANARDLLGLLTLSSPRPDCPLILPEPVAQSGAPVAAAPDRSVLDERPLPDTGNVPGFLAILLKEDLALSSGSDVERAAIIASFKQITTVGEARRYAGYVLNKVALARAARAAATAGVSDA